MVISPLTSNLEFGVGMFMLGSIHVVPLNMLNLLVQQLVEARLLEQGGVTKKLMKAGFAMEFMLDHIHLLAYAMFSHKAREGLQALDCQIEFLKKSLALLEVLHGSFSEASSSMSLAGTLALNSLIQFVLMSFLIL